MCIWIGQRQRLAHGSGDCGRSVESAMEGAAGQMLVPVLGIVAAAAVTFYTVSFMEMRDVRSALCCSIPFLYILACLLTVVGSPSLCTLRLSITFGHDDHRATCDIYVQKSFEELDEKYSEFDESGGRQRRSRRRAERDRKKTK